MGKQVFKGLMIGSVLLACACTNIFTSVSKEQTDAALEVTIIQDMDNGDYSGAIALFPQLSTAAQNQPSVKEMEARAYMGRAGLNFLTFVTNLSAWDPATTNFFPFLIQNFPSGSVQSMSDAQLAQSLLVSIGSPASPGTYTNDQLFEIAAAAMVNMGNILTKFEGNGPGGFVSACGAVTPVTPATTDPATQFGVSFNLFLMAMSNISGSAIPAAVTTAFGNVCAGAALLPADFTAGGHVAYDFCSPALFTAAGFTTAQLENGVLSVINESTMKMGLSICGGTANTGGCFCP